MKPTKSEIKTARAVLSAELELLKGKVASGSPLRVGERRHLLAMTEEADNDAAYRAGYAAGLQAALDMLPHCRELKEDAADLARSMQSRLQAKQNELYLTD